MRLWHVSLIKYLPRQQLLGQHRECCALRGKGWGKPHATVNYVFQYSPLMLYQFHLLVMQEMEQRGYHADKIWLDSNYRGKSLGYVDYNTDGKVLEKYPEHDQKYLTECIDNLKGKGVVRASEKGPFYPI
ncbi:MAG: TIGR02328 family protein [Acidaminococcaceae bacterium]|nr:TIGR02328 family protein [Acidaminococcaceae bacterium]